MPVPEMKVVRPGRARLVHVETELGIVNIYVGLSDRMGRQVEAVMFRPGDGVKLIGTRFVKLKGKRRG